MAFPSISTPVTGGTFAAADGTTLQSANAAFVKYAGSSDIVTASGQGKVGSGTYTEYGLHTDPGSALVEGTLDIVTKPTGNRANGIWFNAFSGTTPGNTSSDRNGHQIEIDTSTTVADALFIYTVVNGTNTQVATSTATTFSNGDSIGWRISGTTNRLIEIFRKTAGSWNQTPILTYTDTGAPAGRQDVNSFAVGMTDSSGLPGRIDNLVLGATSAGTDATVTAVVADGTGTSPAPAITADSNVAAPPADGTGASPVPAVSGTGSATVTPPAAAGTGDSPDPTVSAGANVTTPPADGTGTAPPVNEIISAEVTTGPASGTGSAPAPAVSGSGSANVTAPPATGTGQSPAPVVTGSSAGQVISPPATGTGSSPAPGVTAGSNVTAPPADGTGAAPAPTIALGVDVQPGPADGTGTSPAPTITADANIAAPPADGTGTSPAPLVDADVPVNSVPPLLTRREGDDSVAYVGDTLDCTTGTWTDAPTGYTYLWRRSDVPETIVGATSASYQLTSDDFGHSITCRVAATNAAGTSAFTVAGTLSSPFGGAMPSTGRVQYPAPPAGVTGLVSPTSLAGLVSPAELVGV